MRVFTPECKQISALWYNMDVGTKWQLLEYTVSRATKRSSVHRNLKALSYNFTFTLKYPRKQWCECPCKEIGRTGLLTKGVFHLSELTGQTIPVVMRISLLTFLTKTLQPDQSNPKVHQGAGFSAKLLEKAYFIFKLTGRAIVRPASSDKRKAP